MDSEDDMVDDYGVASEEETDEEDELLPIEKAAQKQRAQEAETLYVLEILVMGVGRG